MSDDNSKESGWLPIIILAMLLVNVTLVCSFDTNPIQVIRRLIGATEE